MCSFVQRIFNLWFIYHYSSKLSKGLSDMRFPTTWAHPCRVTWVRSKRAKRNRDKPNFSYFYIFGILLDIEKDLKSSKSRINFIKFFTPYAWNLCSAPILFAQIYSNRHLRLAHNFIFSLRFGFSVHFTPCSQLEWNPSMLCWIWQDMYNILEPQQKNLRHKRLGTTLQSTSDIRTRPLDEQNSFRFWKGSVSNGWL
jgi:hypothetical protein